jgi:hypothetical protein
MKTRLNLASKPFTNHRLLWLGIVSVWTVVLWSGLWIHQQKLLIRAQVTDLELRIKDRQDQVERAQREEDARKEKAQQRVLTDQQMVQLASARFMIARKSFSWNKLLSDIEQYIPPDTRVTGIRVGNIFERPEGQIAEIEFKAIGKTAAQLTEAMGGFENSKGVFVVGDVGQGQVTDTGEVPFSLNLEYRPFRRGDQ